MKRTLAIASILVILSGCGKHPGPSDNSLMTVAGHVLTVEKADAMLNAQLAVAKNPKRVRGKLVNSIDRKFVLDCVIKDYAKANGISADLKEVTRRTSKLISRNRAISAAQANVLEDMIRSELLMREVHKDFVAKQKVEIPAGDVQQRRKIIERINNRSNATNAFVYAQATNCWMQLVAGKINFQQALELYDQTEGIKDPDGVWGEFSFDAFPKEEAKLREILAQMNPGDITPPVPGDNGLVIVKLLGTGVNGNNPNMAGPVKTYKLARIFFHLYETFEPQSDEELQQDLRDIEIRERWDNFLKRLVANVEISYAGNGDNLEKWKNPQKGDIK